MCLTVDETICIVAIIQAIVAKLYKMNMNNTSFNIYRLALIKENKFRAARYGIDNTMIDFGLQKEVETKLLIIELLDFIDDVVDELGSRDEINYVHQILNNGTGADKQLAVFHETRDLSKVVDFITGEFTRGL
jgi:carboxylate-amine ligase